MNFNLVIIVMKVLNTKLFQYCTKLLDLITRVFFQNHPNIFEKTFNSSTRGFLSSPDP